MRFGDGTGTTRNVYNTKTLARWSNARLDPSRDRPEVVRPRQLKSGRHDVGTRCGYECSGHLLVPISECRVQSGTAVELPELSAGPEQDVDDVGSAALAGDGV